MASGDRRRVPTSLNIPSRGSPVSSDGEGSSTHFGKPLPPISNIPGLNHDYATGNYREPVRTRSGPSRGETEYLRLVRQGGRKDLLHYKEFVPGETNVTKDRPKDSIFYQLGKQGVGEHLKTPGKYNRQRRDSTSSSDSSPGAEQTKSKAPFKVPRKISPQDHNILEYHEYQPSADNVRVPRGPCFEALDHGYDAPWERDDSDKEEHAPLRCAPLRSAEMRRALPVVAIPTKKSANLCRKTNLPKVQAGSRLLNSAKPIRVG